MGHANSGNVFIQGTGHVTLAVRLARDIQPVCSSKLQNYDGIATDQGSGLLLPGGFGDVDRVAGVAANECGSGGTGMGLLARVVKVMQLYVLVAYLRWLRSLPCDAVNDALALVYVFAPYTPATGGDAQTHSNSS